SFSGVRGRRRRLPGLRAPAPVLGKGHVRGIRRSAFRVGRADLDADQSEWLGEGKNGVNAPFATNIVSKSACGIKPTGRSAAKARGLFGAQTGMVDNGAAKNPGRGVNLAGVGRWEGLHQAATATPLTGTVASGSLRVSISMALSMARGGAPNAVT